MFNRETERVGPLEQRRQGDILRIEYPNDENHGPGMGLVINADCDLKNQKTDGVVSYLPVYSFQDYITKYWMSDHFGEVYNSSLEKILSIIRFQKSESEELKNWIVSSPLEEVLDKICSIEHVKINQRPMIHDNLKKISICLNTKIEGNERFSLICQMESDPALTAKKHVAAAKKSIGEGHFFVSDIVGHDDLGFVVRMRRIYSIADQHCFTSETSQKSQSDGGNVSAVRFARLTPLYRFKVAQLFAQQFSRIGLPDELTSLSEIAIDSIAANLSKGSV